MALSGTPRPGDLFARVGDHVIWAVTVGPRLNLKDTLPPRDAEAASFYLSYANMDAMECIEWQLSEKSNELQANPFLPLLHCYGEGFYPFSLSPNDVVLFAFET